LARVTLEITKKFDQETGVRLSSRKRRNPRRTLLFTALTFVFAFAACGKNSFTPPTENPNGEDSASAQPQPQPTPAPQNEELAICSDLALKDVVFPSSLDYEGRRAIALGLNISGSFEGGSGWKNITNNFDGQGLSLGLLNQCLGQGSLQPLMIKMRDRNPSVLRDEFGSAHLTSLLGMLSKWEGTAKVADFEAPVDEGQGDEDLRPDGRLSDLDMLPDGSDGIGQQESASSDSVAWAKQTLYTDGGTTFQATWKKELQRMSADPAYVSIQIEAALSIHNKAMSYMKTLGLHELRSYLFLFDVNVQNGGLYSADITAYKAAFPAGSTASETTRLKKILAIRITHVIEKYKNDVNSRKLSIINGTGVVHGSSRNYPKEYCFANSDKLL
jgi:hypothetical protein